MESKKPSTVSKVKKNAGNVSLKTKVGLKSKKGKVHKVGPQTKKTVSETTKRKSKQLEEDGPKEFQLDLGALDGYDLPDLQDKEDVQLSKPKRLKQSQPEILGVNYREMEEKRLEELLFGALLKKFNDNPQAIKGKKNKSHTNTKPKQKGKGGSKKQLVTEKSGEEKGSLPQDVYGNHLGLSSTTGRQAAWVDEDDEAIK